MQLTFGLDYDGTYTFDPGLWNQFIKLAQQRGHKVVIVTARCELDTDSIKEKLPGIEVYATSLAPKKKFMDDRGVKIDIWIDDHPEVIGI